MSGGIWREHTGRPAPSGPAAKMTIFTKLRNHWKKTTAGICLLSWGGHWLYEKHCDNLLRRAACQEAQVFGNQLIPPNAHVKKATVFLNPAACKGKARTLFEKNAAPILHLSGMDVTVVKTDYEGQAKKLLELMENTDVIIVAGGDGTLQEVVTGVLRRADEAAFSRIPIGFIPLGQTSTLSQTLFAESGNKVQHITDATLAIVKGETVPLDVLQIKGEKEQPVFAMTGLRWGSFRDAGVKVSKYWYLGPLKTKAAHFFSTLQEWPQTHQASISYMGPKERPPSGAEETPPRPSLYRRILRRLASYWAQPQDGVSKEVSPEVWRDVQLSTIELSITTRNSQLDLTNLPVAPISLCLTANPVEFLQGPVRHLPSSLASPRYPLTHSVWPRWLLAVLSPLCGSLAPRPVVL
ncbi:acylglycerol kinase, mitochondrial isoform X4 [Myotis myotis]|uniref:acylglycerol kinase, mitochondrial isoform X4 n=1 Tax=Myotis myotis TaxID=51298 RepID=UPI00174C13B3|nr:acylglycerol kinase, mitochondrial isoform X4 [Myotis myotis]